MKAILVEDNLMFAMSLEPALRRLGYEVRTLAGGPAAVEQIAAAAPDVVFVNLASGRHPGADLVQALRKQESGKRVPVVGYAGHVERHLFTAGREAGCDLVVPNSAMRQALPEVLQKLHRRITGDVEADWPEED